MSYVKHFHFEIREPASDVHELEPSDMTQFDWSDLNRDVDSLPREVYDDFGMPLAGDDLLAYDEELANFLNERENETREYILSHESDFEHEMNAFDNKSSP